MDNITTCLAENVRSLRKENEFTQTELAEKAGISLIFLQGIESERKWISPTTAAAIAKALRVPQHRLFESPIKRKSKDTLDHIPDDVYRALAKLSRHREWEWDIIRWILEGYKKNKL